MAYSQEVQIATAAVQAAARLCEAVRQDLVPQAMEKRDRSPVTIADYGAQALICEALATTFPDDPVVGEEDTKDLRQDDYANQLAQVAQYVQATTSSMVHPDQVLTWIDHGNGKVCDRYWTLDPIDGTKGFLRGDQYAVALALVEKGDLKVGLLACPALVLDDQTGWLFTAVRGQGASRQPLAGGDPQPIAVSTDPENLRFVESVEASHGHGSLQATVAQAVGISRDPVRMDSQAKYAAVASGQAALYLRLPSPKTPDYREKIWDHAAGALVVEEAGGTVTDMHGQPLDFSKSAKLNDNQGVVVSNGEIHAATLAALVKPQG